MENKYYTPVIEEFHTSFEYEVLEKAPKPDKNGHIWLTTFPQLTEDTWYKFTYPDPFLGYRVDKLLEKRNVRVKYLDKEDIESLGFHTEDNGECYNLQIGFDLYGLYPWENNRICITKDMKTLFDGKIKNKSELKKLLKQLNISNE